MRKFSFFVFILLYKLTVCAQTDSLIGLPFNTVTPDSAIRRTVIEEFTDLTHMGTSIDTFKQYKKHKALAVNYELTTGMEDEPYYYLGAWGGAWEYSSIEEAKKRAIEECKTAPNYDSRRSILLLMIDDSLTIPEEMFTNFKKLEVEIQNKQQRKFEFADRTVPLNNAFDLTKFAVDVQSGFSGNRGDSVRLNPYLPLEIGYSDWNQDYASACQDRIFYVLKNVNVSDTSFFYDELRQLSRRGLYGAYNRAINTVLNYTVEITGRQMEKIAKYSSHLNLKRDSIKIILPSNLEDALHDENIQEIWVEGTVRITDDGIPLKKDTIVKPLAILTDKNFYIAIEIRMPNTGSYCALSEDFHDKVIDVTNYKKDAEGREKIYATLMKNLEKEFSNPPISAQKIQKLYPPGEMWMDRDGLPSLILGNPYWESSTYTFTVYYGGEVGDFENVYDREAFKGVAKKDLYSEHAYIYLQVANISSNKAHKNDPIYIEVSKDDQAKYAKVINGAIDRALKQTCLELKGKMDVSICNIK